MANYYLKCLGIIHWRLRGAENKAIEPVVYVLKREGQACLYLIAEPRNTAESELFAKIAAASGLKVVEASLDVVKSTMLPILGFGPLNLANKSLICLPALGQLINSVELKRQVWQSLRQVLAI